MKKRFTILMAAMMLLATFALPMGMKGQSTYTKVTETPTDWSGTYVIVADESSVIFTGQSGTNNYGGYATVTISNGSVTGNFASYEVEIEQSGTYYSIKHINSSKYLGWTSGNYLYFSTTAPTANTYRWVLSTSSILNANDNSRKLQYNSSSPRFACYTSNQKVAYLYKKETGGGTTPTMSVSTNSIDFGSNVINPANPYTQTFEVTFANLTQNLTVTGFSGVTVTPSTINANATSPQTVTVTYNPTTAGSISGNISVNSSEVTEQLVAVTGSAYDPSSVDTYEKYTGAIVEGDYVIYANNYALKNTLNNGPRFNNESVTPTDNKITNPDASIIWHIAPIENTNYWTIYNSAINKYAGGTSTKNQGALLDEVTDFAKWEIYYQTSILYIANYGRSQQTNDPNNKYIRQNGTNGWATYAMGTGAAPQLYKKVVADQVAMPTFSPVGGTYFETQSVTLNCSTNGATIYYTTDGTTPSASNGTVYTTAISVSTTTTIKAIAIATGMTDSDVATATYTIEQPYSTIPALFAAATATEQDVRVTFDNWVVSGVSTNGKNVYVTDNSGNGFIIYFTSDMSGTFAAGDILSGTAVACKLKLFNGAAELVNLNTSDLTITDGGNVSIVDIAMASLSGVNTGALVHYDNLTCSLENSKYYLTDGTTTLQAYNTLYAFDEFEDGKTYNVTGLYVQYNSTKEIAPRSTSDIEEVVVTPVAGDKYVKVTADSDLTDGQYLIIYEDGGLAFDGSLETLDAVGNTISVTISNNEIASTNFTVAAEFTINKTAGTIKSASGYYIGQTSDANGLQSNTATAYTNTISFDEDGNANIISEGGAYLRYNSASNQTRFRYYKSTSYTNQGAIQLYKKVVEPAPGIELFVSGYNTSTISNGGYHLIASPIMETVLPTAVTNMIDATPANYDLYRFNQDEDIEWQNYKGHTDGFVIEPGKAYLYAHNTDVTLTFNGTAYNGNGTFNLTQSTTNTSNGGKMNALGNPYNATASIGSRSFYKMNADGTALEAVVGGTIGALEGIVVNYDANNPTVTFSTSKSRDVIELLTLNLQEQDNVIDNVIVRFDGGDQLLKYQIFDSSKIYVTVDGEDYAVVRGENQGTLPVNFMALSNGTYTISMDFENMTFSYLHLIDNLTGEDIDMLTTTSYSFDATTEDDANRFTLVYSKDGEGTTETLTFYDGDTSSGYVPVYGFYADAYQKVEFIMPAEDLYALTGATINKMTWYLTTPAEVAWGGNFKIYLMETEATTPANYADLTNATLVYDGPLDGTGETLEINFATGFLYEGDNLLVAVHQTETGTYKSATFAGSAVTGAALQGYSYNNLDQVNQAVRDFLPKTTFEFTPGSGAIYYKPKQLQASEIGITSAVLTWEAGDDETSWGVEYKKVTEDTWTDAGTVDQLTITLDNLEAGTEYEAHVKSIYTDGESGWTTIAFATEACEETDKGEVAYTLTDTYGDGWNNNKLRIFLSGTDIMIAELTLTTGSELEGVVKLCYDTDYDLVWVAGNYAYETGFVLTAPDGTIIYEYHGTGSSSGGTTPTPGVLTTFQIHNGFTKTIEAYTDNSGYYLIASPVGNVLASNVTNMVDGNYDLYMFDQTGDDEGKQWLNYKANAFSYLEVGLGYLYASESDVTLTFSGTPISSDDDYAVEVNYNASSDFPGLNLLGNPFADEAYLVNAEGNGLAYHRLNPANNTYVTVDDNSAIPMMEGVFYEAGENDVVVYFSATAPATSKSNLNITVSQGRGMVDNAIVRFGEGNTLRKISLRDNSTKVYIPQNGSEYALVNANEFGEMPVNFKAESNGTYTMSFSNQNVEFGYLHLIDNLTGADVDLLANPSYSFEAKVSDYASRFKLVFATGNDDSSSDFAFVSNDEIIVNGEGMLQVIDMTGRIISTSQVNGMSSIKLNAAAGVYVLRLNDKTQKIVIK